MNVEASTVTVPAVAVLAFGKGLGWPATRVSWIVLALLAGWMTAALVARQPDVRDVIEYADSIGELARLDGADWNLEIGVLAEIFAHSNPGRAPAVLFDKVKGYPAGMRIVSGLHNTCRRLAYAFGFPDSDDPTTIVKAYRDRMK